MDSESPQVPERREIYFSGRVQGVGFRYTACAFARRHGLRGYVENLPDGRVHLVAEGPTLDIEKMLKLLGDEMQLLIRQTEVQVLPANDEFSEFNIRR